MVDYELVKNGVFSDGDVNGDILSLTFDRQLQTHAPSLVLARVREQGQSALLSFNGCGLQEVKGPPNEAVLLPVISTQIVIIINVCPNWQ